MTAIAELLKFCTVQGVYISCSHTLRLEASGQNYLAPTAVCIDLTNGYIGRAAAAAY